MMFKLLTCDQTRQMLSHNLLFRFIWHMFWDWVNRLQMFTLFYIPAGSSVHPKSVFSHNSFCCWQHFFWWIMGLDVSLATRHRRCFSNWLIEFILRYWKREKASKTSAKADWSQKLCSLCKMHKRRFSNWASPHFLAVPRPKYGGWWILGKSGNCANPAKSPTATKTLQSCWLHSTDCYRNIQNGRRLSFLLKVFIFSEDLCTFGVHLETIYSSPQRKQRWGFFCQTWIIGQNSSVSLISAARWITNESFDV